MERYLVALGEAEGLDGLGSSQGAAKLYIRVSLIYCEEKTHWHELLITWMIDFSTHLARPFFKITLPQLSLGHKTPSLLTKNSFPSIRICEICDTVWEVRY